MLVSPLHDGDVRRFVDLSRVLLQQVERGVNNAKGIPQGSVASLRRRNMRSGH